MPKIDVESPAVQAACVTAAAQLVCAIEPTPAALQLLTPGKRVEVYTEGANLIAQVALLIRKRLEQADS